MCRMPLLGRINLGSCLPEMRGEWSTVKGIQEAYLSKISLRVRNSDGLFYIADGMGYKWKRKALCAIRFQ